MDVCQEKSSHLVEKLSKGEVKMVDEKNFVYNIEGFNVFGRLPK